MFPTLKSSLTLPAVILAVTAIGCTTAGLITGHLTGSDFMLVVLPIGGAAGAVTGAHVGSTAAVNAAAASSGTAPSASGQVAPSSGAGVPATTAGVAAQAPPAPTIAPVSAMPGAVGAG